MCGRYEVHTPVAEIARRFDARLTDEAAALPARYNVAPTLRVPVVRASTPGRLLEAMTWGLVPGWAKDLSGIKPINARAETVFDSPMFRNAVRRRRCLVPADGFYEWQVRAGRKQPFHIGMADGGVFAFGGIWEYWAREGEEPRVTCAILVTRANELMAAIHDRVPVIIAPEDYAAWLDPQTGERSALAQLFEPYPAELMRATAVGTRVNNVKNDGPDLVAPLPCDRSA
jgi:putative SOS response-associated peptidase YedK